MAELPRHPLDKTGNVPLIPRSQIQLASYNPRTIGVDEKRRLKRSLEVNGLSEPFIYNSRTQTLVSGHQRLSILDHSAPDKEWAVPCIVRDLSDAEEKQLNVSVNNQKAMGRYDDFKLGELLKTPDINIEAMGFDLGSIKTILPDIALHIPVVAAELAANSAKWKQEKADKIAREDAAVQRIYDGNAIGDKDEAKVLEQDDQFYFCVVFKDFAGKMKFLERIGVEPMERFVQPGEIESLVSFAIEKGWKPNERQS